MGEIAYSVKESLLSIENILKNIEEKTTSRFSDSLTCIILYVLLPLVKEHLGEDTYMKFKRLFDLYIRSEYNIESLTTDEAKLAIENAKEILRECYER